MASGIAQEQPPGHAVDTVHCLAGLPASVLAHLATYLSPATLLRLESCSRAIKDALSDPLVDDVWRVACDEHQWSAPQGARFKRAYCLHMARRCVECGRTPTHYLFPLLGCRLCPDCEQCNPRFRLVTELEARQAHGLSAAQVAGLDSLRVHGMLFYLEAAAVQLARGGGGAGASRRPNLSRGGTSDSLGSSSTTNSSSSSDSGSDHDDGGAAGREAGEGPHPAGLAAATRHMADLRASEPPDDAARQRRKEAKKQAKAEQRLRRELRAGSLSSGARYHEHASSRARASPPAPAAAPFLGGASPPGGGSGRARGGGAAPGRQQRDRKKLRHLQAKVGSPPSFGARQDSGRRRSEYVEERERLMAEWGPSISGLVLATGEGC